MLNKKKKGFTLIELLIVIAIIAILAAIIFVAIDPAKRGGQARDSQRWSEVNSILNAVLKYGVDNEVSDFSNIGITTEFKQLGTATSDCSDTGKNGGDCGEVTTCLDLTSYLVDEYLSEIPQDPKYGNTEKTGYLIKKTDKGRIEVRSCMEEQAATDIKVTR